VPRQQVVERSRDRTGNGSGEIAILLPYWDYFEASTATDLRATKLALGERVLSLVSEVAPASPPVFIDSAVTADATADRLGRLQPRAFVVLQTLAAPPAWTAQLVDALPDIPLVVAALQDRESPGARFDHSAVTEQGAVVGGAQLTNVLVRRGRPFRLVTGWLDDPAVRAQLGREVTAAHAAGTLRAARLLRVGRPLDGYECVDCDSEQLRAATGITLVDVEAAAVRSAYLDVCDNAAQEIEAEVNATWNVTIDDAPMLQRSLRMAVAMEQLEREHATSGGVMNCHVPELRLGSDPGLAPCFALGRQTSRGRPWSCTGDLVTAVAMLTLKLLGACAWYHEIETLDHATDEALLACSGEHDLALAPEGARPTLRANPWWPGVCASFTPEPGPATLLAFTPSPVERKGFRFIVAEGEFTPRRLAETGTVNAAFRVQGRPVAEHWTRWARAGASHHAAASGGHHAAAIAALAEHLGVGCIEI
jgi:L-arabinose isomerase